MIDFKAILLALQLQSIKAKSHKCYKLQEEQNTKIMNCESNDLYTGNL